MTISFRPVILPVECCTMSQETVNQSPVHEEKSEALADIAVVVGRLRTFHGLFKEALKGESENSLAMLSHWIRNIRTLRSATYGIEMFPFPKLWSLSPELARQSLLWSEDYIAKVLHMEDRIMRDSPDSDAAYCWFQHKIPPLVQRNGKILDEWLKELCIHFPAHSEKAADGESPFLSSVYRTAVELGSPYSIRGKTDVDLNRMFRLQDPAEQCRVLRGAFLQYYKWLMAEPSDERLPGVQKELIARHEQGLAAMQGHEELYTVIEGQLRTLQTFSRMEFAEESRPGSDALKSRNS